MSRWSSALSILAGLVVLAAGLGVVYLELYESPQLNARVFGFAIMLVIAGALWTLLAALGLTGTRT